MSLRFEGVLCDYVFIADGDTVEIVREKDDNELTTFSLTTEQVHELYEWLEHYLEQQYSD